MRECRSELIIKAKTDEVSMSAHSGSGFVNRRSGVQIPKVAPNDSAHLDALACASEQTVCHTEPHTRLPIYGEGKDGRAFRVVASAPGFGDFIRQMNATCEDPDEDPMFINIESFLDGNEELSGMSIAEAWSIVGEPGLEASVREIRQFNEAVSAFFLATLSRHQQHKCFRVSAVRRQLDHADVPERAGVYFVQQGAADGPIKIGKADNARRRIRGLQTGSATPLRLLALVPGGEPEERALHARFAAHRMLGEWFAPAAEILAFVEGAAA